MTRRIASLGVLVLSLAVVPTLAGAQRPDKIYRIGMLERTSATINAANLDAFRQGLRALGYVEGKNVVFEYRSADGHDERFAGLAAELVRRHVDLILTRGTPATLAARNATAAIPVVVSGIGDPVAQGIAASLAHPGGNVTGLSGYATELYQKRVELLKEILPGAGRIAALINMSNPALPLAWKEIQTAARALGINAQLFDVRRPEDLARAFESATAQRADGVIVGLDTLTQVNQRRIVDLAAKHRLPAIYASAEFTGGLVTYGVSYPDLYRRAATFADKIFKGASPGDLPMEQPTKFELIVDLRTARALGLSIPPAILLRADQTNQ